jgi:hypothetical protein
MSALVKYKNPVEHSFYLWMRNHPESGHPLDKERFLKFAKNVCAFNNAGEWKQLGYLEKRILQEKPKFDQANLSQLIIIFESLIDFYRINSTSRSWQIEVGRNCKRGYYIECGIKNGQFYEKELIMPKK